MRTVFGDIFKSSQHCVYLFNLIRNHTLYYSLQF